MASSRVLAQPANQLLAQLPSSVYERLAVQFRTVSLKTKQTIYRVQKPLDYIYFPTSGIISTMAVMKDGRAIEVATVGKEGMTGLTAFMGGGDASPYEVMVQVAGEALRIGVDDFQVLTTQGGPLRDLLGRYHSAFSLQVSYAVACNGLHNVSQRVCRWLLISQDRIGSDVLPITHELLGIMLGVRRASVTEVLNPLQVNGDIRNGRGSIKILDRHRLEKLSCECYRATVKAYEHLLGARNDV